METITSNNQFSGIDEQTILNQYSMMSALTLKEHASLPVYKIAILGVTNTGKSNIVCQYLFGTPRLDHIPTFEDNYTQNVRIDNEECELEILDTPGAEETFYKVLV